MPRRRTTLTDRVAHVMMPPEGVVEYRLLGRTALRVSALGYGASPLGSVFRPIDERQGVRAVHRAIDMGINYFDVSPDYGSRSSPTCWSGWRSIRSSPTATTL